MPSSELKKFSVGGMDNNVYILVDSDSRDSVLFDAPADATAILAALRGTQLKAILMTHTDLDHIQALNEVRQVTGAPVGVHPSEAANLPVPADFLIHDGDVLRYGGIELRAMHVPGHTPGGLGFYTPGILIAGDTLFPGGPGNTQRGIGDFPAIIESIRSKFFTLPDDTQVYPGHGKPTTIGSERPHLQEWIDRGH
jgi:glyoxylase-like metal-dependent hydrolase (beta-lactamase superfamily II)